jgi:hypothetical protein
MKYSLLTLTMAMLGVALFEGFVRLLQFDFNLSPYWKYHPVLGWTQVPNAVFDLEESGEKLHVGFNSLGFRESNHTLVKPAGTKRIVVLGDSFCEVAQVNLEQTFFRRLQHLLNHDLGPASLKWEAINLGVGDFGNAQAFIALEKYGLAFSPDIVLLEVFPLNDICNNSIGLFGLCHSKNDPYRPYYVESNGELALTSPAIA